MKGGFSASRSRRSLAAPSSRIHDSDFEQNLFAAGINLGRDSDERLNVQFTLPDGNVDHGISANLLQFPCGVV